jgi:hypothetical protein
VLPTLDAQARLEAASGRLPGATCAQLTVAGNMLLGGCRAAVRSWKTTPDRSVLTEANIPLGTAPRVPTLPGRAALPRSRVLARDCP